MSYSKFLSHILSTGKKTREMTSLLKDSQESWEDSAKFVEGQLMRAGLLNAYDENYPLVEARELIPAFDAPLIEYKGLPAFSVLMLNRQLSYIDESFQFDLLHDEGQPSDPKWRRYNLEAIEARLPRNIKINGRLARRPLTHLTTYGSLLPLLLAMDRGQVLARNNSGHFHLAGIFASFPSDLDRQIKRMGQHLGKFKKGDNRRYALNRQFVYHFLMESLGFPICGERHTSAALFAYSLLRAGESFSIMVLGQSDRTITILRNPAQGKSSQLPAISKIALVATSNLHPLLAEKGFYLDRARRAVMLKVTYQHHRYHPNHALEEQALSVHSQEVIHPQTGQTMEYDALGLSQDNLLMLDSIVHGKFKGSIVYQGQETVQGTRSLRNRLKFLNAWMHKHRFILAEYSMDNLDRINHLLSNFLYEQNLKKQFSRHASLYMQVHKSWQDMLLAHRLHMLQKISAQGRACKGSANFDQAGIFTILTQILQLEGNELLEHSPTDLKRLIQICSKEINACIRQIKQGDEVDERTWLELDHLCKVVDKYRRRLNKLLAAQARLANQQ